MGAVWVARNELVDANVALKVLRPERAGADDAAKRFRHEARLGSKLAHRSITRVYDLVEESDGSLVLVMELLRGKTLEARMREPRPVSPEEAVAIAVPILSALDPTHSVDYEGELTVVIGKGGRGIKKADAFKHVYGYTIINDVTARTLQHAHKQWFLGKSIDSFCPMGPTIVTADEVPDVTKLHLVTKVNGEVRQDALGSDLIFDSPTLIETLSATMTLEPGDLIATGTCAGVGIGFNPPKYLQKGDVVAITIEPIGTLENPVA